MKAVLAQCRRCGSYTLQASVPVGVAVDVTPLDRSQYISSVMGGETFWGVERTSQKALRLRNWSLGSPSPTWSLEGSQIPVSGILVHREHGCPADLSKPIAVGNVPPQAPATAAGATNAPGAGGEARDSRSPATAATPALTSEASPSWPSPMANAARPGPAPAAPTAPAATRPSAPTASATSTASAPSAWTAGAPTPPPSDWSSSPASGVASRATIDPASKAVRCDICRKIIDQPREEFVGLFHERWIWATHERCT